MSLNPTQPCSTDLGLFPVPLGKGRDQIRRKYRALGSAIKRVWFATTDCDVMMHRRGFDVDTEKVSIDTADAVTLIRTIDMLMSESLTPVDLTRYQSLRSADRDGKVVRGLTLIRNSEIHRHVMVDFDNERLVSSAVGTEWRVFPRWKSYADLPSEVRTRGLYESRAPHDCYKSSVGGQLVVETLLDAMRFFDRCDPTLTRRTPDGDIAGFPLVSLVESDYECRHPYWLRANEMNDKLLDRWAIMAPTGQSRLLHRVVLPKSSTEPTLYVGFTDLGRGKQGFVESADQIVWDSAGGYSYFVIASSGEILPIGLVNGVLTAGDIPLPEVHMAEVRVVGDSLSQCRDEQIRKWWTTQLQDAFRYRTHRRPAV